MTLIGRNYPTFHCNNIRNINGIKVNHPNNHEALRFQGAQTRNALILAASLWTTSIGGWFQALYPCFHYNEQVQKLHLKKPLNSLKNNVKEVKKIYNGKLTTETKEKARQHTQIRFEQFMIYFRQVLEYYDSSAIKQGVASGLPDSVLDFNGIKIDYNLFKNVKTFKDLIPAADEFAEQYYKDNIEAKETFKAVFRETTTNISNILIPARDYSITPGRQLIAGALGLILLVCSILATGELFEKLEKEKRNPTCSKKDREKKKQPPEQTLEELFRIAGSDLNGSLYVKGIRQNIDEKLKSLISTMHLVYQGTEEDRQLFIKLFNDKSNLPTQEWLEKRLFADAKKCISTTEGIFRFFSKSNKPVTDKDRAMVTINTFQDRVKMAYDSGDVLTPYESFFGKKDSAAANKKTDPRNQLLRELNRLEDLTKEVSIIYLNKRIGQTIAQNQYDKTVQQIASIKDSLQEHEKRSIEQPSDKTNTENHQIDAQQILTLKGHLKIASEKLEGMNLLVKSAKSILDDCKNTISLKIQDGLDKQHVNEVSAKLLKIEETNRQIKERLTKLHDKEMGFLLNLTLGEKLSLSSTNSST